MIRFAGGVDGGVYNDVSTELATSRSGYVTTSSTEVVASGGSLDNRDRLLAGAVDLAPMQATAISGDHLCVVAPLFYEVLYVLAKADSQRFDRFTISAVTMSLSARRAADRGRQPSLVFDSLEPDAGILSHAK